MEKQTGLSASALKYFAAFFMLVDHVGVLLEGVLSTTSWGISVFYLLRSMGRIAFPIFLFFVAEGCHRTGNFSSYLLRLGIFAAISEVPFRLFTGNTGSSVILTFFLGALAIYGFERLREQETPLALTALPLLGACIAALVLNSDYGLPAVLLLFSLHLCGADRRRQVLCLSAGLALFYLVYQPLTGLLSTLPVLWSPLILEYLAAMMPFSVLFFLCTMVAVVLLTRYSGARGGGSRWFFYVFYPAHMLVLFFLGMFL